MQVERSQRCVKDTSPEDWFGLCVTSSLPRQTLPRHVNPRPVSFDVRTCESNR